MLTRFSPLAYLIDWGWLRIGPPYIYINIDPVILHLGPFALHWYGLMYVVAIVVGLYVAQSYAIRKGISQAAIYRTLWWCVVAGLLGGRLYFVVQQPDVVSYYLAQPQPPQLSWSSSVSSGKRRGRHRNLHCAPLSRCARCWHLGPCSSR